MVMVTVEILEIEVLFCTYVWVTSYILMVEKAIKKGLFHTNKPFFICMYQRLFTPIHCFHTFVKHNAFLSRFLRKRQIDLLLQQDTVSLQKQSRTSFFKKSWKPSHFGSLESSMNGFLLDSKEPENEGFRVS